jgi:hypothetical protein
VLGRTLKTFRFSNVEACKVKLASVISETLITAVVIVEMSKLGKPHPVRFGLSVPHWLPYIPLVSQMFTFEQLGVPHTLIEGVKTLTGIDTAMGYLWGEIK